MAGNQEQFQKSMNQGHSAAWDQLWDRAAAFYRQALEELPNHPKALISMGLALYELQQFEESLRFYQRAAIVSQEDPVPMEKVAHIFERLGNIEQAIQSYLRAAELNLKNRDVNRAIENWSRVLLLNPENVMAHSRLALVYERLGDANKAATEYLAVASLFQGSGDMDKAVRSVNKALQLVPNHDDAIQALAMLRDFKLLPKPTRPRGGTAPLRMAAVKQLEAPKVSDQRDGGLDPIGQARQKALTMLADLLFEGGDDEELSGRGEVGDIMRGKGRGGRQALDRKKIFLHLSQVVDQQTHNQNAQATVELERTIDAGLDHPAAYYDLGYLYLQAGELERALRNLQMALNHPDLAVGTRLMMGDILQKQNRSGDAAVEYLEALKLADSQVVPDGQADMLRQLYDPLIESTRQHNDPDFYTRLCDNVRELLRPPGLETASSPGSGPDGQPG